MDFVSIYAAWLIFYTSLFSFLGIFSVLDWRKRGSSDGFSSVNLVLPCLMMSCWLKHGHITDDAGSKLLNTFSLFMNTIYIFVYGYYQSKKTNLYAQLTSLFLAVVLIFTYVDSLEPEEAGETMGSIAATTQIATMLGGLHEVKRVLSLKTTEYLPFEIQFAILTLVVQWLFLGLLTGNKHIIIANAPGLILSTVTLALYYIYPPITWRVPIIGTQQEKKTEKKD